MRRMGIGLGVGINRSNYAQGIFSAYQSRVVADGGVTEAGTCVDAVSGLLQSASLLLIPSGYKGGKAYAEIPTNGNGDLTWTRASDAWRTNADGLIQRVPWNLALQSETFENASWSKSASSITANSITAPNGTITADTFTGDGTLSNHRISQSLSFTSGVIYTISCYIKKDTNSYFQIYFPAGQFTSSAYANYDLDTGTVGGVGSNATASIENVGNGWYRCVATATATSSAANTINFGLISSSTSARAESNTLSTSVYIWGAQLVEGSSAQTYFPTTDRLNVPRLSYMYGSCPALLLEPQRTNLGTNSQNFADASWAVLGATKVSTNLTDPSNTNTACNVTWPSGGGKIFYGTRSSSPGTYTISFYVKSSNGSKFRLYDGVSTSISSDFTATSTFQRFSYTFTQSAGTGGFYGILSASDGSAADIVVAFAQFEAGSYATTYIPTTTASATRIADSFSRNNIYTNGLITSSGGTWFVELRGNLQYTRDASLNSLFLADTTSGGTNGLVFRNQGSANSRLFLAKRVATAETTIYQTTTDTVKIAIKWNGTTADVFANGTKVTSATSFTTTNMEFLYGLGNDVPKFIQAMGLHPTPLTDAQCIELTTL